MEPARYEWDEAKRVENLAKHGIDFYAIHGFDWSLAIVISTTVSPMARSGSSPTAPVEGRLYAIVYTLRDEAHSDHKLQKGEPP